MKLRRRRLAVAVLLGLCGLCGLWLFRSPRPPPVASLEESVITPVALLELPGATIRLRIRPELGNSGLAGGVHVGQLYRAEPGLLLQGRIQADRWPPARKGNCPPGVDGIRIYAGRECFAHDPDCGCHGPVMQPGMVAWAGGRGGGPDFFIYLGDGPATHWSHDHTVFAELADPQSLQAARSLLAQSPASGFLPRDKEQQLVLRMPP